MITILERPQGHILDTTEKTATVSESYGAGDAQFVVPTVHGLVDGDYIYSVSNIEDYAGFFYVDVLTTGIFKLKTSANGEYVQFVASGSITWYKSDLTHGWSAVHLPITYKLSTDLYPVNSSDTSRTITSVTDYNGFSVIHLSGDLGSVHTYDFIKITVPSDTDFSGVYQIVEFISPTVMIINLEYDGAIDWTSATALKHYNNYNILVRVYAGLNASHEWAALKPYEMAATLELTPDDNNEVFFSINEILKSYITTRNNTGLASLPNNIDFMTMFYIETAESYDDSDGYTFGTYQGSFTSDQSNFEGYAVNAKLEFKNLYSGYLSEYIMTNSAAKFLTLFTIPVLFSCGEDTPNCYQDISLIIPYPHDELVLIKSTGNYDIPAGSEGVYRHQLEESCTNEEITIQLGAPLELEDEFFNTPGAWVDDGSGVAWTQAGAGAVVVFTSAGQNSGYLEQEKYLYPGSYNYGYSIGSVKGGGAPMLITVTLYGTTLDDVVEVLQTGSNITTTTTNFGNFFISISKVYKKIALRLSCVDYSGGTDTMTVNHILNIEAYNYLSEEKTIEINCNCSNHEIRITWLNNLGGFEHWAFTAKKDHLVELISAIETKVNILPQWPKSYGATADTVRKQTSRVSNKAYTVRSQFLTEDQANAISFIKSSVLVQIINSRLDKRTVIVDTDSFVKFKDGDKTFEIAFNISFTDDIPVQTV